MSVTADNLPAFAPWSLFSPLADLPDDLNNIYRLAVDPIKVATAFCSFPERFDFSAEDLSAWNNPLQRTRRELQSWLIEHEAEVRAEALDVLSALQMVLGEVMPLCSALDTLTGMLNAVPADPKDAHLVQMVNAVRENTTKNLARRARLMLEGKEVSGVSLEPLRTALSSWANRRSTLDGGRKKPLKFVGEMKRKRGGKPPLEKTDPMKFQVYERIHKEHTPGAEYRDTVDRLQLDKDFVEQVKATRLRLNCDLVRNVVALFGQRERAKASKKQETQTT